ncbi:MAG: 1-deoxy-D-xylulose-5-phosphate reductoisomerase [Candidatus Coproplasma sp.]
MRKIALIGSTGSIGRQTLSVVRAHPDKFKVCAMSANSSVQAFSRQLEEFTPEYAAITDADAAKNAVVPGGCRFSVGDDGALKMLEDCGADVVVVACSGFSGLKYSLKTAETGAVLALANKESLVCGGDVLMPKVKDIAPVDSEHSAIWQCLNFDRNAPVKNLIITASGGPFRDKSFKELAAVTPEQALSHPTWNMGAKITVDSATLLNKGYEVIEAHHLYNMPYSRIKTVIQPQSIVHSMVEYEDGAVLAQMSNPTMELPIQLALTYPQRYACSVKSMDFTRALSLEFLPLVRERYPFYDLALTCGEQGGILPCALNAASEVAVYAFLDRRIGFTDIFDVAERVVASTKNTRAESYSQLEEVDSASRAKAREIILKRCNG